MLQRKMKKSGIKIGIREPAALLLIHASVLALSQARYFVFRAKKWYLINKLASRQVK
jgi:hypothetical protein